MPWHKRLPGAGNHHLFAIFFKRLFNNRVVAIRASTVCLTFAPFYLSVRLIFPNLRIRFIPIYTSKMQCLLPAAAVVLGKIPVFSGPTVSRSSVKNGIETT